MLLSTTNMAKTNRKAWHDHCSNKASNNFDAREQA